MILKEMLNQSRVLTMSNNRGCNYLSVDCNLENSSVTVLGIIDKGSTLDIVLVDEIINKKLDVLVDEVKNLCYEFNIKSVLIERCGINNSFYEKFIYNAPDIQIRYIDKIKSESIFKLKDDIENSKMRLLQTYNIALNSYKKHFLGYRNVMKFHKETDTLIDEIDNIDVIESQSKLKLVMKNEKVGKSKLNCLMTYYTYKYDLKNGEQKNKVKEYEINKRNFEYEIVRATFYKYMFKALENAKINVIFFCSVEAKINQFVFITKEEKFKDLFYNDIQKIVLSKERLIIELVNGSLIRFVYGSNYARGYRCHYAIVDTDIDGEIYEHVIRPMTVLYDLSKEKKGLKDKYNIEFVKM